MPNFDVDSEVVEGHQPMEMKADSPAPNTGFQVSQHHPWDRLTLRGDALHAFLSTENQVKEITVERTRTGSQDFSDGDWSVQ